MEEWLEERTEGRTEERGSTTLYFAWRIKRWSLSTKILEKSDIILKAGHQANDGRFEPVAS